MISSEILPCLAIPFLGTVVGSAVVLFMRNNVSRQVQRGLIGFATGVMVAASVWSLLIPAMEHSQQMGHGNLSFLPAVLVLRACR